MEHPTLGSIRDLLHEIESKEDVIPDVVMHHEKDVKELKPYTNTRLGATPVILLNVPRQAVVDTSPGPEGSK